MRDLTIEELLKLATIDPIGGKGITAYQEMLAFQSSMEAIQMAGTTQEKHNSLTCVLCGKSAPLTEQEAQTWRWATEQLEIKAYCACGGEVKVSVLY